jgi:ABC-type branched-subunit amino acid transport system ATPase component
VIGSETATPTEENILEIEGLTKRFGGMIVLDNLTFAVPRGQIHAVIGPNGAGKTSLFNLISGIYSTTSGTIRFRGEDITNLRVSQVAARGLGRTFQVPRLFDQMTLLENMLVPAVPRPVSTLRARSRAMELLALVHLDELKDEPAAEISGGQKKLLEFMRTMMFDPELILLDEPFNGVSPALIERLIKMVLDFNNTNGTTFLLVSHEIPLVTQLCKTVAVLSAGRLIARDSPERVRRDPAVIEAYLGQ